LLPVDLNLTARERYRVADLSATCPQFARDGQKVFTLPATETPPTLTIPVANVILPVPTPPSIPDQPLTLGTEHRGTLTPGTTQIWVYLGQAGQVMTLRASADVRAYEVEDYFAGLDTLLVIFAPDGHVVAQNDDADDGSGDAELTFTLPMAGVYRVEVRSAGLATGGAYTLSASLTE